LRGDPENTISIINTSKYAQKYTSGVLSFAEKDLLPDQKRLIIDEFERALLPALDKDQYDILWVEHQDKGRLELNFVIPNIELTSGKRLQPYYDRADRPRVDAFQTITNIEYDLADPNDPARVRPLTMPSNLPDRVKDAQNELTDGLMRMAANGLVKSRKDVTDALRAGGYEIARETKSSISIKNPEGGRNIRLKGALYAESFAFGRELQQEIEARAEAYRGSVGERLEQAHQTLAKGIELKREHNLKRHPRPPQEPQAQTVLDASNADHLRLSGGPLDERGLVSQPELHQGHAVPDGRQRQQMDQMPGGHRTI